VILYVLLGRVDEARQWLGRLQEIVYGLTIAGYKAFLAPILLPEVLALYLEALRKCRKRRLGCAPRIGPSALRVCQPQNPA